VAAQDPSPERDARFAIVRGRVQGVGFRYATLRRATQLGLAGSVRNRPDGSVEVYAEGAREALDELVTWLGRGPSYARIDRVDVEPCTVRGATQFEIA
jgi:acylphosphatase